MKKSPGGKYDTHFFVLGGKRDFGRINGGVVTEGGFPVG